MMSDRRVEAVGCCRIGSAVVHRTTDIDAGWETVEHDAANFVLQDIHKVGMVLKILLCSVNRGCQMAIEF